MTEEKKATLEKKCEFVGEISEPTFLPEGDLKRYEICINEATFKSFCIYRSLLKINAPDGKRYFLCTKNLSRGI